MPRRPSLEVVPPDSAEPLPAAAEAGRRTGASRVFRAALWAIAILLLAAGAWAVLRPPVVTLTPVTRGTAIDAVYASGTVEAIDRVEVKARLAGVLDSLLVREGDRVTRGQLLARLDPSTLRVELERGQAAVVAARGRSLPALEALRAQERQLQAQLDLAQRERQQGERLLQAGSTSPQEFERQRVQVEVLQQQLAMVRAQLQETEILRQSELQRSQSDLAASRLRFQDTEIRSPIEGYVLRVRVDPGQFVQTNEALIRLGNIQRLQIEGLIDEEEIARVRVGQPCAVRLSAFPQRVFRGKVERMAPEADRERNAFRVFILLEDPPEGLRPGMTADVNVIIEQHEQGLLVDREAVKEGEVWVFRADGRIERRAVKTGLHDLERIEILSGLAEKDQVVLRAEAPLADGMKVRGQPAPRTPKASGP
jgi:HlyD family secretion protein